MKKLHVCIICHNIKRKLIFIIILLQHLFLDVFGILISKFIIIIKTSKMKKKIISHKNLRIQSDKDTQ